MKLGRKLVLAAAGMVAMGLVAVRYLPAEEKPAEKPVAAADGQAPLAIKLPKPAYIGTPKNVPAGIKKPGAKPREPYMAPAGCVNLALKRPVSSSDKEPVIGQLAQITDGDKEGTEGSWVELGPGLQWVQIDLGKKCDIHAIVLWHIHSDPRVYKDVVVQISDDQDFIDKVQTVFNNDKDNSAGLGLGNDMEYVEYFEGELMPVKAVQGRYVRLYSRGNTNDDQNHYTEVEVWGIPAK